MPNNYFFLHFHYRFNCSLHARIEESNHEFSFDCHDPGVYSSRSVRGLLEHYKEPLSCMFFEPMLLHPVKRNQCFTLQELARAVICDRCSYSGVGRLPLPKSIKSFLREYSYRHKVRSRVVVNSANGPQEREDNGGVFNFFSNKLKI